MVTTAKILKGKSHYECVGEMTATYLMKPNIKVSDLPMIGNSKDAYNILLPFFEKYIDYIECGGVIFLNKAGRVIATALLFVGGTDSCIIDGRVIFQHALLFNAHSVIIAHNHPSGNLKPSEADIKLTKKIDQSGQIMNIQLLDHIIVCNDGTYLSFKDEGLL